MALAPAVALLSWIAPAAALASDLSASTIRGVIRAEAAATVSSEIVARIEEMPFRNGQSFAAGDVLVKFDCRRYEAELRAANAELRASKIAFDGQAYLLRHNATGATDLALAEAKLAQTSAAADALRVRTSQCIIAAPYDGRIVERIVDVFEMPQANAPLMRIVKEGGFEVDLIVPSHWAARVEPGDNFRFRVDETGSTYDARLIHSGAVVDPVSRTMKLSARLIDAGVAVRPGMSGTAEFPPKQREPR